MQWIVRSEYVAYCDCRTITLGFAIYSGLYSGPGAKQASYYFRIAYYLIADKRIVQAHPPTETSASSALSLSRSDKVNITNPGRLLQLLKTGNAVEKSS
ncbi:hypothetical protein [Alloacidobacterium sp.]|uniref:hypothetical protein n=1 Tax=Alloacidobacterium sp. TaxID=2951999 RepID=UPI002D5084B9|nr:hypothetical protein [Alloacidobacterium sp.]HYK37511.1 hypothetical protein [Alloacidobacterium sp.]